MGGKTDTGVVMKGVITKEFRAKKLNENVGDLYTQISETTDKFLEQHGLYFFKTFKSQADPKLIFHYNEGTSGIINYSSKTVKIKGLAGVINNTKRVLESVSKDIELVEK